MLRNMLHITLQELILWLVSRINMILVTIFKTAKASSQTDETEQIPT